MTVKEKNTPFVHLALLDNGILVATYGKQKLLTLAMAKQIVQARLDFVGRDLRPVLIINEGVTEMDKGARKWVSSGDGIAGIKASAVIAGSLSTWFIMSLILQVERPPMPVRVCRKEDRAMAWLETFL
jgi:hypothetical protein